MHDDPDFGQILSDLRLKPVRRFPSRSHIFPGQTPILDSPGEVLLADMLAPLQIGDGAATMRMRVEERAERLSRSVTSSSIRLPAMSRSQGFRRWRAFNWALQWIFVLC